MMTTDRLVEFVLKTTLADCPEAALIQIRRAALDTIGCMLAGAAEPVASIVREVARAEGSLPLCTVVGTSLRTSPTWAALANGAAGHAHDFDDTSFALMGHPSVPLLAAALAAGEAETADGAAVTLAYLIGFEVDAALGSAINPDHYTRGWHATATIGTIGCAAAALASTPDGLGQRWHVLETGVAVKPYPSCALTRSAIDALVDLKTRHGFTADQVAGIEVCVNRVTPDVLIHASPTTALERKFSMQFCAAAAAAEGRVDLRSFDETEVPEPVRSLMTRVTMVVAVALPA